MDLPARMAIYGAGGFGLRLARALEDAGCEVVGFVDRSKAAPLGYASLSLESVRKDRFTLFVGISSPGVDLRTLFTELRSAGIEDIWNPVQACIALKSRGVTLENYWMTGDVTLYETLSRDQSAARVALKDDRSRQIFDEVIAYRESGNLNGLSSPDPLEIQYMPVDVPFLSAAMRFVDIGAFDGDTVRSLKSRSGDLAAVISLEPDPANFSRLVTEVRSLSLVEAIALPLALGDATETLRFNANSSASASRDDFGATYVQSLRFDDLAPSWKPTHVKMDVEGAEPAVLAGMTTTLIESRPALAISIYHEPAHHWSIQNWIMSMELGYEFYMRSYGYQTFDTVLYCIPTLDGTRR